MEHGSTCGQKGYCVMERLNMYLDMVMLAMVSHFLSNSRNASIILVSGNLHLNIVADAYLHEIQEALEPYIYEVVGMSSSARSWTKLIVVQHRTGVLYPLSMGLEQ